MRIIVSEKEAGKTVKEVLRDRFAVSARFLAFLKRSACLQKNGVPCSVGTSLAAGDILTFSNGESELPLPDPAKLPFKVLYADDLILCVDKPAGMPTHQSAGHRGDTLADCLAHACRADFTLHAVTRLDKDTSGVVLVARHALAAAFFAGAISRGEMEKTYFAVTHRAPTPRAGRMEDGIAREEGSVLRRKTLPVGEGDYAATDYAVADEKDGRFLLRLCPLTGRTHQLRVQLSSRACPIVGDWLYGGDPCLPRQALHAASLTFSHPLCGRMTVNAPLPQDMVAYFEKGVCL